VLPNCAAQQQQPATALHNNRLADRTAQQQVSMSFLASATANNNNILPSQNTVALTPLRRATGSGVNELSLQHRGDAHQG